jgi:hypothetical protein
MFSCVFYPDLTLMPTVKNPPKKQGFVSQDPIGGSSMKREYTNTHVSIQYHDI